MESNSDATTVITQLIEACKKALPALDALANISGHGQPTDDEEAAIKKAVADAEAYLRR